MTSVSASRLERILRRADLAGERIFPPDPDAPAPLLPPPMAAGADGGLRLPIPAADGAPAPSSPHCRLRNKYTNSSRAAHGGVLQRQEKRDER